MHRHAKLVEQLGGGTAVAAELTRLIGRPVDREAVYKWQNNGIARDFRIPMARLLLGRGKRIPAGLLPDGLNADAIEPFAPVEQRAS